MFGIDILPVAFAAHLVSNTLVCDPQAMPKISVSTTTDRIEYEFRRSQNQLARMNIDTVSPYGREALTVVGGLMSGEIEVSSEVQLGWITHKSSNQNCFWYNDVKINMHIDPKIYIAHEHKRGTCEHDAVHEHEMKHIEVDRRLVARYKNILESHIKKAVRQVPVYGPVASNKTPRARKELSRYIEKAIEQVSDKMYEERKTLQQQIDTKEEYERVRRQCL